MYSKIVNPVNGKKVNLQSKMGKQIIRNYMSYVNQLGGSSAPGGGILIHDDAERVKCEEDLEEERRKYEILVAEIEVLLHPDTERTGDHGMVLEEPDDPLSRHYNPTRDDAYRTLAECKKEISAMQDKYDSLVDTIDRALHLHAQPPRLPGGGGAGGAALWELATDEGGLP